MHQSSGSSCWNDSYHSTTLVLFYHAATVAFFRDVFFNWDSFLHSVPLIASLLLPSTSQSSFMIIIIIIASLSTALYRKIELEYTFYHSFRSTFRILMSLLKNKLVIQQRILWVILRDIPKNTGKKITFYFITLRCNNLSFTFYFVVIS